MDRLKVLGTWILITILFYIFSNAIIYMYFHGEEIGGKIYNMTHKETVVNEVKENS